MQNGFISKALAAATATAALLAGAATQGAFAQGLRAQANAYHQPSTYFDLSNTIRVRNGTLRILKPRCDSSYPMDEWMRCGTATGGPVGGRGA